MGFLTTAPVLEEVLATGFSAEENALAQIRSLVKLSTAVIVWFKTGFSKGAGRDSQGEVRRVLICRAAADQESAACARHASGQRPGKRTPVHTAPRAGRRAPRGPVPRRAARGHTAVSGLRVPTSCSRGGWAPMGSELRFTAAPGLASSPSEELACADCILRCGHLGDSRDHDTSTFSVIFKGFNLERPSRISTTFTA